MRNWTDSSMGKRTPYSCREPGSVPHTHMAAENLNSSSRSATLIWPLHALHTHGKHTHKQEQHSYIQNNKNKGAGEMAQWLGVLASLPKGLSSTPSTHMGCSQPLYVQSHRISHFLLSSTGTKHINKT